MHGMRRIVTVSDGTVMLNPRRISAGAAALIFFAMFFALPLYAAATMCTMPCCHHATPGAKLKSDLPACPTSECLTAADETTVKAVSRYVAPSLVGIAAAPVTTANVVTVADARDIAPSPPRSTHDVQLLNSTFRI
jgi:hypothetical protein